MSGDGKGVHIKQGGGARGRNVKDLLHSARGHGCRRTDEAALGRYRAQQHLEDHAESEDSNAGAE